jgi:hypothetical protein
VVDGVLPRLQLIGYWAPLAPLVELDPVKLVSASAVSPDAEAEQLVVPAPAGAGLSAGVTAAACRTVRLSVEDGAEEAACAGAAMASPKATARDVTMISVR